MADSTQLVVIGAGPGGYAAAFYATDRGLKVSLIDPSPNPGGVCLYRGCIPSKALLHVADVINEALHAEESGVTFGPPKIDVDKVRAFKDKVVGQLTGGVGQVAKLRKIDYIQGTAAFRDPRTLEITGSDGKPRTLGFEHAIIATGSRPATCQASPSRAHASWTRPRRSIFPMFQSRCWSLAAVTSVSSLAPSTPRSGRRSPSSK